MIIKDTKFKRIQLMANHGIPIYPKTLTTAVWDFDRDKSLKLILDELNPIELTKVEVVDLINGGDLTDTLSFELTNEYTDTTGYFIALDGSKTAIDPVTSFTRENFSAEMITTSFIKLPEGVEYIGDNTFMGMDYITGFVFPRSLKAIGVEAFDVNRSLLYIELRSPLFVGIGGLSPTGTLPNAQLRVPANLILEYKSNEFWAQIHRGNVVALVEEPKSIGNVNTIYYEGKQFYPITKTDRVIHNDGKILSDILDVDKTNIVHYLKLANDEDRYFDAFKTVPGVESYEMIIRASGLTQKYSGESYVTVNLPGSYAFTSEIINLNGSVEVRDSENFIRLTPYFNLPSGSEEINNLSLLAKVEVNFDNNLGGIFFKSTSVLSRSTNLEVYGGRSRVVVKSYGFVPPPNGFQYSLNQELLTPYITSSSVPTECSVTVYKTGIRDGRFNDLILKRPETDLGYWRNMYTGEYTIFGFNDPAFSGTVFDGGSQGVPLFILNYIDIIKFPEGTTEIGEMVFGSSSLREVILPSSVKKINRYSFYSNNLKINLPEGLEYITDLGIRWIDNPVIIPSTLKEIGDRGISSNQHMLFFANPKTSKLEKIGPWAFSGFELIRSVYLPDNLKEIGDYAFGVKAYLEYLRLPPNLEKLGDGSFHYSHALRKLEIPPKVKEIPSNCFDGASLNEGLTLNLGLEIIGSAAFQGNKIPELNLPSTLKEIKESAFYYSSDLEEVRFPDGLVSIGAAAFMLSHLLKNIYLGSLILSIGATAFGLCSQLTRVEITALVPPTLGEHPFDGYDSTGDPFLIYVPAASLNAYKTAPGWIEYADKISAL